MLVLLLSSILFCCLCSAESYSIYIKGLPYNATPSLLDDEFKKYGTIRNGGIQVRSKVWPFAPVILIFTWNFKLFSYTIVSAARFLFWLCGVWGGKCRAKSDWGISIPLLMQNFGFYETHNILLDGIMAFTSWWWQDLFPIS